MKNGSMLTVSILILLVGMSCLSASAADLQEIKQRGVLQHLGVPYANFVTGTGDGFDVELTKLFARHLGVRYEYVKTSWSTVVQDLVGIKFMVQGSTVEILEKSPTHGDLIANGFTILPWRKELVNFSQPTFPSQIWLIAHADSKVRPIKPSGNIHKDIEMTRALMKGRAVLSVEKTCLAPDLYNLSATGAKVLCFAGQLNELAPAVLKKDAEMTILDVPDALIALGKWPGKLKIIGPISEKQLMAVGFAKDSPQLLAAFNKFLTKVKKDGTYLKLIRKYYPTATFYFPDFFAQQ